MICTESDYILAGKKMCRTVSLSSLIFQRSFVHPNLTVIEIVFSSQLKPVAVIKCADSRGHARVDSHILNIPAV